MVFEAPDGPLGLILFLLGQIWSQDGVSKWVPKVAKKGSKNREAINLNNLIKNVLVHFLFLFGAVLVTLFGTLFELQNWSKIC